MKSSAVGEFSRHFASQMCRLPQPWFLGASLIKEPHQPPSGYVPFKSHGGVLKNVGGSFSSRRDVSQLPRPIALGAARNNGEFWFFLKHRDGSINRFRCSPVTVGDKLIHCRQF